LKKERIYLIDFDGTITKEDTLTEIAISFYPEEAKIWWSKLQSGEYSIKNWLDSFKERFDIPEIKYKEFLKS
jgi:2-hydroxy-3-keto-5-methylthiopentenyl-1-phosphate phosphatase